MTIKIICFNAPPRSGKTTSANILEGFLNSEYRRCCVIPLAEPIYQIVGTIMFKGFDVNDKKTPLEEFGGKTLRETVIAIGETLKQIFGQDIWINRAINRIVLSYKKEALKNIGIDYDVFVIPDIGFQNELTALVSAFGEENITLVKLLKDNCNYDNDSRCEVNSSTKTYTVKEFKVDNNGTKQDLMMRLESLFMGVKDYACN